MYCFASLLVLFLCSEGVLSDANPGTKIRVMQNALDIVANSAVNQFFTDGQHFQFPDQVGSTQSLIGTVYYEITNNQVTNMTKPSSNITITPNGINWTLRNAKFSVQGLWKYIYKMIITARDSGNFTANVVVSFISLSIVPGLDNPSGNPTVSRTRCNCSIGSVSIKLNGGGSWLYNTFLDGIENALRNHIQPKLCDLAKNAVNVRVSDLLASFPLQYPVGAHLIFDFRLLSAPRLQDNYMECLVKGAFRSKQGSTDLPTQSAPFPADNDYSRMVSIWISVYTLNTLGHAMYQSGDLSHDVTKALLPDPSKDFLNTTCSGKTACFGTAFPKVSELYPNASVELEIVATKPPTSSISSTGLLIITGSLVVNFRARLLKGSLVPLFTVNITLDAFVSLSLNGTRLRGNLTRLVPTVAHVVSSVGPISNSKLENVLEIMTEHFLIPMINSKIQEGILLPVPKRIQFKDAAMEMQNGFLSIKTNVALSP